MKWTMTKHGFRWLPMLVLFSAWLFSVARMDAQAISNHSQSWKTESEALTELDAELLQMAAALNGQTPGTPAYQDTESRIDYYKTIYFFIEQGKSVAEAIQLALGYVDTTWIGEDYSTAVLAARDQWYNGALGLLTN